ncbi:isoprenylcysteine carboxylmethyltransferase family protein [Pseudarthrobacter sp. NIBRBAC000502771]|nr:isoprenylcysteine carboxylmethyltransferase family protein [Pseudarthrobacter sp. NIBRBAC000502771]
MLAVSWVPRCRDYLRVLLRIAAIYGKFTPLGPLVLLGSVHRSLIGEAAEPWLQMLGLQLSGRLLMKLRQQSTSIDIERVILVPIMALLLLWAVSALFSGSKVASSSALVTGLHVSYQVLMTVFYLMAVYFLLTRNSASARSGRIAPTVAAYVGTFLPFLLAFAGGTEVSEGLALFSVALMTLGMVFTVWSLMTLGKSFGVEPQVRTLVQHGPYRLIRNPLYVGEMITLIGAVCFSPTLLKMAILVALAAVQAYRAIQEEQLLAENVPEYAAYKLRTARFVPGLF